MKILNAKKLNPKLIEWIKLISLTGSVQLFIQALSFLSGILVIRLLPTNEYAFYTIANTMLGTINLLSDSGISSGVMAQGGKVWQDKDKLGVVLMTGLGLRRKFAIGSLILGIPILLYLLIHQGASWLTCLLIIASLVPAFYAALVDSILQIVPKLHQAIIPLQKNQMYVSSARLGLSALTLFIFPFTAIAIIAAGIPRIFGNIKLKKIASVYANTELPPNEIVQKDILKVVKRELPTTIYYCLSGQINIWLISVFGKTSEVAQLGAIGRITIVLSIASSVIYTLIVPRFARIDDSKKTKKTFWQIQQIAWVFSMAIVFVIWVFSDYILMVLGPQYSNLNHEMALSMLAGGIALVGGLCYSLCASRGWVLNPIFSIIMSLNALIIGISICDIGTLVGVIHLDIIVASNQVLLHMGHCIYRIYRKGK
jgi:O-antigen/teichoic acid export membrane protein